MRCATYSYTNAAVSQHYDLMCAKRILDHIVANDCCVRLGTVPPGKPDLPWAASTEQLQQLRQRITAMRDDEHSCLFSGLASVAFQKAFGDPGALKTSEYLLLCGPIGKYILQDTMHPQQQRAVFRYLDKLGLMWQKTITRQALQELEREMPVLLAELEYTLPAWELDINRHMMQHLVESIRQHGPCWTWSMFGFERLWGRLVKWMSQVSKTSHAPNLGNNSMVMNNA